MMDINIITPNILIMKQLINFSTPLLNTIKKQIVSLSILDFKLFERKKIVSVTGSSQSCLSVLALQKAISFVKKVQNKTKVIFLSPVGKKMDFFLLKKIMNYSSLCLIDSRYEGFDERALIEYSDMALSIGDYVISNGSIAILVVLDALCRMIGGIKEENFFQDSFSDGQLDYPCFAKPNSWKKLSIPSILLSGNSKLIDNWKNRMKIWKTVLFREDLLFEKKLSKIQLREIKFLKSILEYILDKEY